jgi:chorismate lyase/3-hydroxybenzoate synthase
MRHAITNLHNTYLPYPALLQQTSALQQQVLGAICFSAAPSAAIPSPDSAVPLLQVALQPLAASAAMCEVWHGSAPLAQGQRRDIRYRCSGEVIFGVIALAEADFSNTDTPPLQQATEAAYQQIGALLDALRYPYVFRFWNYMADINGHSNGLERYRQFNLGRQHALLAQGREVSGNVPAACALGASSGAVSIAFLAGRVAPEAIENPRQISAYTYPQEYGPRSPTFSRASLVCMAEREWLFISGTASIVGHASLHPADVLAQTRETMSNIEAVLAEANRRARHGRFVLAGLQYKVYIKHPDDLAQIRAELESRMGPSFDVIYLQADVCRQELLIEIEATASHALVTGSPA